MSRETRFADMEYELEQMGQQISTLNFKLEAAEAYRPVSIALMKDNIELKKTIARLDDKLRNSHLIGKNNPLLEAGK